MTVWYAKVIVLAGTFEDYRQALMPLAGPGIDLGLVQVGVREALVRPHLLRLLVARHPGQTAGELLRQAGASRIDWLRESDAWTLYLQRVPEDLDPRPGTPPPDAAGGLGWFLQAVRAQAAWAAVGAAAGDRIDWQGVRVGQIDTGYTRHRALGFGQAGGSWLLAALCRTMMDPGLPPDLDPPAPPPDDGVDPMPAAALFRGHGTRVGALLSGHDDAATPGLAFRGVAPRVPHVVVRITDSVAINNRQSEFARALRHLVDVAQVDVVNVSLGVTPPVASPAMKAAVQHAHAAGVIVVCAAGNVVDPVCAPACLPQTLAVAGSTWQSLPWHGSSFGPEVDFSAPASDIFRPQPQPAGTGTAYAAGGDGTSYATAIASASAALWLRRWGPQIAQKYGRSGARVEAFRRAARATCRVPPGWQPEPFGAGILDTGRLCTDAALALP